MRYETQRHPKEANKLIVLDHETKEAKEVTIREHWLYVRMTERKEEIDGIYLPQKSRDDSITLYEIIAISDKVNDFRKNTKKFNFMLDMDCNAMVKLGVGDTIMIPEKATGEGTGYEGFVLRSPWSEYEGFIDKGLVLGRVP